MFTKATGWKFPHLHKWGTRGGVHSVALVNEYNTWLTYRRRIHVSTYGSVHPVALVNDWVCIILEMWRLTSHIVAMVNGSMYECTTAWYPMS